MADDGSKGTNFNARLTEQILQHLLNTDARLGEIVEENRQEIATRFKNPGSTTNTLRFMMVNLFKQQTEYRTLLEERLRAAESGERTKSTNLSDLFESFQPLLGSVERAHYKKPP